MTANAIVEWNQGGRRSEGETIENGDDKRRTIVESVSSISADVFGKKPDNSTAANVKWLKSVRIDCQHEIGLDNAYILFATE